MFLTWPNMTLTKHGTKDKKLVSFWKKTKPWRGGKKKRREEEKEEEKKKRKEE